MAKKKYDIETDIESNAAKAVDEPSFSKEQLKSSKKYGNRADVLSCIMTDSERLTFAEVDNRIQKFMKGGK